MMNHELLVQVPARAPNQAAPAPEFPWPAPHRAAMLLSFDVDAEAAWIGEDPAYADRLVSMSYGGFEARVGTPRLLELLSQLDLKGTFFIPGWTIDAHPAMCEAILKGGHEIGHHGYHHVMPESGAALVEEIDRGLEALKRVLGVVPAGYRAPSGEFCEELRELLVERGFLYTSSFRDDVRPYRHILRDGRPGTIELPVSAGFDDWVLGLHTPMNPARQVLTAPDVLSLWGDELDEVRDWGAMVTTVLHPQCSGRPARLRLLRSFLQRAKDHGDVWITTGEAIAKRFLAYEQSAT